MVHPEYRERLIEPLRLALNQFFITKAFANAEAGASALSTILNWSFHSNYPA